MNNRLKKGAAILCAMTMAAGLATGCGNSGNASLQKSDEVLFQYDGQDVTLREGYIYAQVTAANYEQYYGGMFGSDFWGMDMGDNVNFEGYVKEQVIGQIKQVIVLDHKAAEAKITLTDDEKADCARYAEEFAKQDQGKKILSDCGAKKEDIQKIYEDNKLASKMIEEAVKDTDTKVSDEEARQTTISRIVFETSTMDEDGNMVEMTDKEKADVKEKAEASLKAIQGGTSFEEEAANQEYTNTSETFGAGGSEEGAAFEEKLAKKKDGELFNKVQECDNGYVVAKLVAYTDKEATENQKAQIVEQRKQEKFSTVYEEWTKDLEAKWDYKKDVNQTLWAEVKFHEPNDSTSTEITDETTAVPAESDAAENSTAAQ